MHITDMRKVILCREKGQHLEFGCFVL